MTEKIIGIVAAMPEEIEGVIDLLSERSESVIGMRRYISGKINNIKTVVVFSRWGKVASAATVVTLIQHYNITQLIFTGVAGAIDPSLKIGDTVIAEKLIQHDMDARPLMDQYEIPLLGQTYFYPDTSLLNIASKAIKQLISIDNLSKLIGDDQLSRFNIKQPELLSGDIASGDQFFSTTDQKMKLHTALPGVLCVEMEGAAVAQVCYEYNIPFIIIRTISDTSDERSHIDFPAFINKIAGKYSTRLIENIFRQLHE